MEPSDRSEARGEHGTPNQESRRNVLKKLSLVHFGILFAGTKAAQAMAFDHACGQYHNGLLVQDTACAYPNNPDQDCGKPVDDLTPSIASGDCDCLIGSQDSACGKIEGTNPEVRWSDLACSSLTGATDPPSYTRDRSCGLAKVGGGVHADEDCKLSFHGDPHSDEDCGKNNGMGGTYLDC